jgi:hypothetical protein
MQLAFFWMFSDFIQLRSQKKFSSNFVTYVPASGRCQFLGERQPPAKGRP